MIHPEDIGDFEYKRRIEDQGLFQMPEEEIEFFLDDVRSQEELERDLDEAWEAYLAEEIERSKAITVSRKIISAILDWIS